MRIGIDCRTILNPELGEKAGVGHYTYFLVKHLIEQDTNNQYVLFFSHRLNPYKEFERSNVELRIFPFARYKKFLPFSYSHLLIAAALRQAKLDVFHSPANVLPLSYTGRSVITLHDLAIYKNPDWFPSQVFSTRLLVPQSIKKAKKIIAVSQSTADDATELFGVPTKKINIVPEGVDTTLLHLKDEKTDVRKKYKLPKHYLLFVGTLEPRKNLDRLIPVFAETRKLVAKQYSDIQLILAGAPGYRSAETFRLIKQHKLTKYVRHIGYVTQNEKYSLMKQAWGFVFPSLYEGFGLPVLEAMQLGAPVITSNVSSLPEVAGGAAIKVNPNDNKSIFKGLVRIIQEPALRAKLIKAGKTQAKKFTWEQTAERTIATYKSVAKSKK